MYAFKAFQNFVPVSANRLEEFCYVYLCDFYEVKLEAVTSLLHRNAVFVSSDRTRVACIHETYSIYGANSGIVARQSFGYFSTIIKLTRDL